VVVVSVVRLLVVRWAVRRLVGRWAVLRVVSVARLLAVRWVVVGLVVRRRIKVVLAVVVFNNNSRWEWEELQCKVVREWVRVWRRVVCSRTAVRQAVVR
jgi:hypothetical protein